MAANRPVPVVSGASAGASRSEVPRGRFAHGLRSRHLTAKMAGLGDGLER
jgi:hypothetical protein